MEREFVVFTRVIVEYSAEQRTEISNCVPCVAPLPRVEVFEASNVLTTLHDRISRRAASVCFSNNHRNIKIIIFATGTENIVSESKRIIVEITV